MNSTEILEGNKLIANFLGWKTFSRYHSWKCKNVIQYDQSLLDEPYINENDGYLYEESELFHSSWDWLMPVIEKIESLNHPVYINSNNCVIYEKVGRNHGWFIDNYADTKIEATWISCVEFIKITSKKQ